MVEYSRLAAGVRVASGCVVSCCTLRQDVCVPEHIFLHTALLADGTAAAAVLGKQRACGIENEASRRQDRQLD